MINPYYFSDETLKRGFKINLESHKIIHSNSILTITPIYSDFRIETICNNKIPKEMATIYDRLINQYEFKYHILFSASFYKINEEDQGRDETELLFNLNINHNSTEIDIKNIDVKSRFEYQIQIQETKEIG